MIGAAALATSNPPALSRRGITGSPESAGAGIPGKQMERLPGALCVAAHRGALETITGWIRDGGDVNAMSEADVGSALIFAACSGTNIAVVDLLLRCGADVNLQDRWGCTALSAACCDTSYQPHRLSWLNAAAESLNMPMDSVAGASPSPSSLSQPRRRLVVQRLLVAGADMSIQDTMGFTPLIICSILGETAIARLLLDHGARRDQCDRQGRTALDHARENQQPAVTRLLMQQQRSGKARPSSARDKPPAGPPRSPLTVRCCITPEQAAEALLHEESCREDGGAHGSGGEGGARKGDRRGGRRRRAAKATTVSHSTASTATLSPAKPPARAEAGEIGGGKDGGGEDGGGKDGGGEYGEADECVSEVGFSHRVGKAPAWGCPPPRPAPPDPTHCSVHAGLAFGGAVCDAPHGDSACSRVHGGEMYTTATALQDAADATGAGIAVPGTGTGVAAAARSEAAQLRPRSAWVAPGSGAGAAADEVAAHEARTDAACAAEAADAADAEEAEAAAEAEDAAAVAEAEAEAEVEAEAEAEAEVEAEAEALEDAATGHAEATLGADDPTGAHDARSVTRVENATHAGTTFKRLARLVTTSDESDASASECADGGSPRAAGVDQIDLPEELVCPIRCVLMSDPVFTADGQVYEREAIAEWLGDHDTSPLTGAVLKHKELTPAMLVRGLCRRVLELGLA